MEPVNVFDLCTDCHQRLDPNGGGEVVLLYDHEEAIEKAVQAERERCAALYKDK